MVKQVDALLNILDLEMIDIDLFRGQSGTSLWQRVFGGHVISQSLVAAQNTVESTRFVHSLHAYFMRPGDPEHPIIYHVTRLRDGRSFSTRHVIASQNGKPIFTMTASFQVEEQGLEHYMAMPDNVPMPEDIKDDPSANQKLMEKMPEDMQRYWRWDRPFALRPVSLEHYISDEKLPPRHGVWVKLFDEIPQNPQLNAAMLAYVSDTTILDTALFAHGLSITDPSIQAASLDHAMWFHRPFSFDDWLFYYQDSPSSSGARGFSRGLIYDRQGVLVASVTQEGLIRKI
ncbi:acyl-CoA thioesterase II [Bartonella sp. HY038]|uniref:acyl-CoA thioesterase II n=1 Tax=Bartonella sp. HY038 TaxID=2759660 RepID=UPI0015FC1DDB|nr:acyl-CoA thioesterase II [Bartonella sp. HY038]